MKCNCDCFNCTIPVKKCKGGDKRTANIGKNWAVTHEVNRKSCGVKFVTNTGRRKFGKYE